MLTDLKQEISKLVCQQLSDWQEDAVEVTEQDIYKLLEVPKSIDHGHIALPMFFLAKVLKKGPPVISKEFSEVIKLPASVESVTPAGGYLNFLFKQEYVCGDLLESLKQKDIGFSTHGAGKKLLIDFSSPNVAKQMNIGHLRATVIGQAILNLAKTQGYEVVGLNHLGDWGSQFGKLAWAIQEWGSEYDLKTNPIESLTSIYIRFHDEADKKPELNELGAAAFKKLEQGDPEIVKLWQDIVEWSMADYNSLWERLGVKHDLVKGESFYNDRLKPTEKLIEEKGLLVESDGAMVVELDGEKPPCLIRKKDGASLYATRDIASALYRMEELKADLNLYVVGQDQTLHFQQIFEVLDKMKFPWVKNCHHISFGMYRFKDIGRMSTRKGNVIFLKDVLDKAVEMVSALIDKKNPDLKDKALVAEQIGVGAVIFNDLMNDRVKNVDFEWERAINFDGDSGPYVQYCNVRCLSLLRKFDRKLPDTFTSAVDTSEERELIRILLSYDEVLEHSFKNFKPHTLAMYLLDVCRIFNQFYHKNRILGEDPKVEESRMLLVSCTNKILETGLSVLNVQAPQQM